MNKNCARYRIIIYDYISNFDHARYGLPPLPLLLPKSRIKSVNKKRLVKSQSSKYVGSSNKIERRHKS
jgi:hypothetical protein